jgi:hypothetical protein
MNGDFVDSQPEPSPDDSGFLSPESDARPARSNVVTRFAETLLTEPDVILTDPPAIFGGASHTW